MLSTDEQMAFDICRAILKQAIRDFHSKDSERVTDVADWIDSFSMTEPTEN